MREQVLSILSHSPYEYGLSQTRWRLESLLPMLSWLDVKTCGGLCQVLHRLDIRFRHGWEHMVSPDPLAEVKMAWIEAVLYRAQHYPGPVCVLWLDELTFYRLPSPAPQWSDGLAPRGPKALFSSGNNTKGRIGAVLNHCTGQTTYLLRSVFGADQLCQLYHLIRATYPNAQEICVIQDCWPVHFLPVVAQTACRLGITLVPLPTYSSWRNPIEKLWRWLKQSVLHMHPWADDWQRTKTEVGLFLDRFAQPSPPLLRYVGLFD